jgi:alpha-L-arabinofuranosidase
MLQLIKSVMLSAIVIILSTGIMHCGAEPSETVSIDVNNIIKSNVRKGAGGANLCWLLDTDLKRPNATPFSEAITELGCGSLRFPYGHLADNYLWHSPPFDEIANGLRPKVGTLEQAPGGWDWAVDVDGYFTSAMDFDEFMMLCNNLNIKPLVVINIFSYKYDGGPTYEELKRTAVEWVKYAKLKGYHVDYWQLGNEIDHHQDILPRKEYEKLYVDFVSAMKAVDPTIRTGPGILSKTIYFEEIMTQAPQLVDFVSAHQYMWGFQDSCATYPLWKEYSNRFVPNIERMQNVVSKSSKPEMDIVITETGVSPVNDKLGKINNTYKALWWFEVLMNEICVPNVSYSYYWGTHSPWSGSVDNDDGDAAVLLRIDDNTRKPTGEIVRIVNDGLLDNMIAATTASKYIRTYATANASGNAVNIFLMNKNIEPVDIVIKLENDSGQARTFSRMALAGKTPDDRSPEYQQYPEIDVSSDKITLQLPPLSVTVLKQAN